MRKKCHFQVRDSQREKLYKAELVLNRPEFMVSLPSMSDVIEYTREIENNWKLQALYPMIKTDKSYYQLTFLDGRGSNHAFARGGRELNFPAFARKNWVVCHEMAHIVVQRGQFPRPIGERRPAGHGWEFAKVYLDIVYHMIGPAAHFALLKSFKQSKVKYKEPEPKKVRTPEEIEAIKLRMEKARAARKA